MKKFSVKWLNFFSGYNQLYVVGNNLFCDIKLFKNLVLWCIIIEYSMKNMQKNNCSIVTKNANTMQKGRYIYAEETRNR